MQSLIRAANEELLGSRASKTSNSIVFLRSKSLNVYDNLADALDAMADDERHRGHMGARNPNKRITYGS